MSQAKSTIKKIKYGNRERYTFSKIDDIIDIPYLIEVQKNSFEKFVKTGIGEVLKDFSPITDMSKKVELHFLSHTLEGNPKYSEKECKDRDATFALPLKVKVRLINKETGEMLDQEVFMGDFPLMTPNGSFIINGAERIIVSQLVRSPSVYCKGERDKHGTPIFHTQIIPSRGAWLEFEEDANKILYVKVDRNKKVTATLLMRALGYGTDQQILDLFHNEPLIKATMEKDNASDENTGLIELGKKLRPSENPTVASVKSYLESLFFDDRRYDLTRVGRYKFNKKLCLATRLTGLKSYEDISVCGEVVIKKGEEFSFEKGWKVQSAGINEVAVIVNGEDKHIITGNNCVDFNEYMQYTDKIERPLADMLAKVDAKEELGLLEQVHVPTLLSVLAGVSDYHEAVKVLKENAEVVVRMHITTDDMVSAINYNIGLHYGIGQVDNIDHLGNRRVRCVGELLQNQFRIGISRLEKVIKERMQIQSSSEVTPATLINIKPVVSAIREFFGSSQLSQFMDQSNPIAELTHKRKLSALGPGGLSRERAGVEVRDVHYSHYGRMCPIETPEGQNIGLISSLSTYARINEYGFIETPFRRIDQEKRVVTNDVDYLAADEEDNFIVAQANEPLDENSWFVNKRVMSRYRDEIFEIERENAHYMDVSPKQLVSVATSLIPFLENDDTNRALMGSNMQRQAVPLIKPDAPFIGTGMEHRVAYDSGVMVIAKRGGEVVYVSAEEIHVQARNGEKDIYTLHKFQRSNQGTCVNQRPLIQKGAIVEAGAVLADGPSTHNTELALGKNVLIGFMSWEGYNYEDAILLSENLVKRDVFTSIHIEEYEIEARDTKLGEEEITRDIPNVGDDALKDLDEDGIIRVGAEVRSGDILVGKVTPKGETELTPEERLLRAIFGEKAREVRDTSLKVPHGESGIIVDVKIFTRENKDELPPGVNKLVRVYIAQKRKISVGDKMAGRHGNKGVISRILPVEEMPFMADGTPLDIVLNPMGVPSRMNIGQVLEVHLGLVAKQLGMYISTPVFDGASENDIKKLLEENGLTTTVMENGVPVEKADGKITLYDGRTGEPFENRVTVGYMYMLKLVHLVDDKIHARSTGPYSLVTQQPLGGKAQFGGQRFGEMEVWALYAYGAANILQEIMTVKSDDIVGRRKTYEAIVKGQNIAEPGVPESFKVLIQEMQALCLEISGLTENKERISIQELLQDDDRDLLDTPITMEKEDWSLNAKESYDLSKHDEEDIFANDDLGEVSLFEDENEDIFDFVDFGNSDDSSDKKKDKKGSSDIFDDDDFDF